MNFTPGQITSIAVVVGTLAAAVINWLRDRSKAKGAENPLDMLKTELAESKASNKELTKVFTDTQKTMITTMTDIRVELANISTKLDRPL